MTITRPSPRVTSTWADELTDKVNLMEVYLNTAQRTVIKQVDETVNNSATLQDDDEFLFAVGTAFARYTVRGRIVFNSGATPDIKSGWSGPAGFSMSWSTIGFTGGVWQSNTATEAGTLAIDGPGADDEFFIEGVVIVGGTTGTLRYRWAQNTANASNTIVRANSSLTLTLAGTFS